MTMTLSTSDCAPYPDASSFHAFETDPEVMSNAPVNREYRLLTLAAPDHVLALCRPGQFFHLLCPALQEEAPFLRRPMSIYGIHRDRGALSFLYKVTGSGTRSLARLTRGDRLNVLGPLGNGFIIQPSWKNLLLVARGVGLATLAPLAREADSLGCKMTAVCSARSEEMLMSLDLFRQYGARVSTVTDSAGTSDPAAMRAMLVPLFARGGIDAVYTCGSNRLLLLLQELAQDHCVPGQVAMEQQMACGLGMCQCCVRSFRTADGTIQKRVCREGPVFDMAEAVGW